MVESGGAGSGRADDEMGGTTGGFSEAAGGSTSGGKASDRQPVGRGEEVRTGGPAFSREEAQEADLPSGGPPEDVRLGGDKPGLDEDAGAGGSTGGVAGGPGAD